MNCSNTNSNSKPNATSYSSNSRKKHRTSQPGYTATNKQRLFVEHNYVDRSNVSRSECTDPDQFERVLQRAKDRNNLRSLPFLAKLHYILEKYEHSGLIQWAPHGRAFAVLDVKRFSNEVMTLFFRHNKYTSFQRQLNLYGFLRIACGRDSGSYYHEYFLKGKPYLCDMIVMTKVKGTSIRAAGNPDTEPDFYSMPFVDGNLLLPSTDKVYNDTKKNRLDKNNGSISSESNLTQAQVPSSIIGDSLTSNLGGTHISSTYQPQNPSNMSDESCSFPHNNNNPNMNSSFNGYQDAASNVDIHGIHQPTIHGPYNNSIERYMAESVNNSLQPLTQLHGQQYLMPPYNHLGHQNLSVYPYARSMSSYSGLNEGNSFEPSSQLYTPNNNINETHQRYGNDFNAPYPGPLNAIQNSPPFVEGQTSRQLNASLYETNNQHSGNDSNNYQSI